MKQTRLNTISELFKEYQKRSIHQGNLLDLIDETEIAERVYNSNAIENSTLSLPETEKILLQINVGRCISLREIFEAKNLALVYGYVKKTASQKPLTTDIILLLHKMLLTNIRDEVAGRFREKNEMVRVGYHIGAPPQFITQRIQEGITELTANLTDPYLYRAACFHAEFENIHPFVDGNGRIGRVINNYLLIRTGFPPIIVRNKEKDDYYNALRAYDESHDIKPISQVFELAILESLHKRLAYLNHQRIIPLTQYARKKSQSIHALLNAARRQTIRAFREKGVWKIGA
jgi:Fic family protein